MDKKPSGTTSPNHSASPSFGGSNPEIGKLRDEIGKDAAKTLRHAGQTVGQAVSEAYDSGAEIAGAAGERITTFATEVQTMARKNPLGAMAAALCVGVLIGLIGRGRH